MWARAMAPVKAAYPHFVERTRSDHFGIALFSKLPLENAEVFYPAGDRFPAIRADVWVNDRLVTLLNLHPAPPLLRNLFNVRNRQLADAAAIARDQDDLVIAAGDLNVTMWSPYYRRFESESGLRNTRRGMGIRPTWPANMPLAQLPLDHVLVSPDILTVDFAVGPDVGSDHLPVMVDLWVSTAGQRGY
jgi:endonuclease/exonuclease/phosphatase (EEP) superfamily protein YafD